jgi:hypothetical protein
MVVPFPEGEPRELMEIGVEGEVGGFTWTTDGRHILFLLQEETGTTVMRVPRSGGDPERLWTTDQRIRGFRSVSFSPDHRKVGLTDRVDDGEIWILENLVEALKAVGGR